VCHILSNVIIICSSNTLTEFSLILNLLLYATATLPLLFPLLSSLPFPSFPALPSLPSLLSLPLPSEVGPLNPARESGECYKLPQQGLWRSASRNWIWCILAITFDIWWHQLPWFSWESTDQICAVQTGKATWERSLSPQSACEHADILLSLLVHLSTWQTGIIGRYKGKNGGPTPDQIFLRHMPQHLNGYASRVGDFDIPVIYERIWLCETGFRYIRNRFRTHRFSAFDWRNWNRFRETIETWSGDGFANETETGNCARVYVELFVVIAAEITTKSNIHIFYKKYFKVLW